MRAILWSSLVLLSFVCSAQVQFENGPWYASQVRDIAIGYRDGSPVMYAVNMSYAGNPTSRTLVKST
jgi:hypothetical protein